MYAFIKLTRCGSGPLKGLGPGKIFVLPIWWPGHRRVVLKITSVFIILTFLGRPFVKRLTLCYRTVSVLSVHPVCNVGLLWPNGWNDQIPLGAEVLGPGDIVLDGNPAPPSTERGTAAPPHFSARVYCGQTVAHPSNSWALVILQKRQKYFIHFKIWISSHLDTENNFLEHWIPRK